MAHIAEIDVAVIGAGPAGLIAAETLAAAGHRVHVFDAMPSPARKFLMAGRGGLNLTHSEPIDAFLSRYREARDFLDAPINAFPPQALRDWCEALGQPTFVGSSGRVFPESFKASPLLRAWLARLDAAGVGRSVRHRWIGWDDDGALRFAHPQGEARVRGRITILALGGASWPRLGSDGSWVEMLNLRGIATAPLRSANCGFDVAWTDHFRDRFEGSPLKSVGFTFKSDTVQSEAVVTRSGIEGSAIYALSALLREDVIARGFADLQIALRPDLDMRALAARLAAPRGKASFSTWLRKQLNLSPVAIALVQEAALRDGVQLASLSADVLATRINSVSVRLTGVAPIDRAISSAGGILRDEVDGHFMLRRIPGTFVAGEMLDWEAPTGGYLLQACFATGIAAAKGAARYLACKKG